MNNKFNEKTSKIDVVGNSREEKPQNTNKNVKKCDHGRVRTCNPQSRNLIFYPVELRSHLILDLEMIIPKSKIFYVNSFFTIVEIVFPSAVPPN